MAARHRGHDRLSFPFILPQSIWAQQICDLFRAESGWMVLGSATAQPGFYPPCLSRLADSGSFPGRARFPFTLCPSIRAQQIYDLFRVEPGWMVLGLAKAHPGFYAPCLTRLVGPGSFPGLKRWGFEFKPPWRKGGLRKPYR